MATSRDVSGRRHPFCIPANRAQRLVLALVLVLAALTHAAVAAAQDSGPSKEPATNAGNSDLARANELTQQVLQLYRNDRFADAVPLAMEVLAIREKALGPDDSALGDSLNNLAEMYRHLGRYAEAEPLFKRALAIYEKALGPDDDAVTDVLSNLEQLYVAQGRYADAEPLFERSLAIDEKALGPDDPDLATLLANLANV